MKSSLVSIYQYVIDYFSVHNPNAASELHYQSPFQLLVAVVLSAQCTDKRVNMITPALFEQYPTAETMSKASINDIFQLIKTISYPNNKAKHLSGLSKMLVEKFEGIIPQNREDLESLPGVGRKSANVILSVCFNQPTMAVDTHVFRVANRIGLTVNAKTPLEVEKQLMTYFPEKIIPLAHHWLILHGRYVCLARKPQCKKCGLTEICTHYQVNNNH